MVWARFPMRVLCCINSLQIFVCEAVSTSRAIAEKNKQWREWGAGGVEDMEFPGGLKK